MGRLQEILWFGPGVAGNMQVVIVNSMENWKSELKTGEKKLGTVTIYRGIYHGHSLLPLLFVLTLIPRLFVLIKVKIKRKLGDLWGKVNRFLYMDDLKLYGQN